METKNNQSHKITLIIIIGVVAIVMLAIVIVRSAITITQDPLYSPTTYYPTPTTTPRSEMWLDPQSTTTTIGRPVTLQVMIDARNELINGADAVLLYDPQMLTVVSIDDPNEPNTVFNRYYRESDGSIQITTIKLTGDESPTPQMTLAQVTFQPIQSGTTDITFDHKQGATNGSTIISAQNSENILDSIRGARITIQ